jgi:uncharacterized membrane protein
MCLLSLQYNNFIRLEVMKNQLAVVALVATTIVLSGCVAKASSLEEAVKEAKCESVGQISSHSMVNGKSTQCSDGSRVYWFPTAEANKNHSEGCKQFGGLRKASGSTWTQYLPSC